MFIQIPGLEFKAHTIFCIGRNYAEHAKELNHAIPKEPVVFLKPLSSISLSGELIELPAASQRVDHEVELVVAIRERAKNLRVDEALGIIAGVGVGIDVTARDLQERAKEKGLPWSVAKGFDTFTVLGNFVPLETKTLLELQSYEFYLEVNGVKKQTGYSADMLFDVQTLLVYLSSIFTLQPGDLIFTGTPAGVSPLQAGDQLYAALKRRGNIEILSELSVGVRQGLGVIA